MGDEAGVTRAARSRRWIRGCLLGLILGYSVGSLWLLESNQAPTTYAAGSFVAALATGIVGLALLGGGLAAYATGLADIGMLTVGLGIVWWAPLWVGWEGGPPIVRSLALVIAPFTPALLLLLVAAIPAGEARSGPARVASRAVLAVTCVYTVARALVRDPFRDLTCWDNCHDNVLLIVALPDVARDLDRLWWWVVLVASVGTVALVAVELTRTSAVVRSVAWPVLASVVCASTGEAWRVVLLISRSVEEPSDSGFVAAYLVRAAGLAGIGVGVSWAAVRRWRVRAAVVRLSVELAQAPAPGGLRDALAEALGDPRLTVGFPVIGERWLAEVDGHPIPEPHAGQVETRILRDGEVVAVVRHDPGLLDRDELEARIGACARLAVDNERLRATLLARVDKLRAARARVVALADGERSRLERDLHDGAQQRLIALMHELRLAQDEADRDSEERIARAAESALATLTPAVDELRSIAHGMHPAILAAAGLSPALRSLADDAPIPMEVVEAPSDRAGEAAERAVYLTVARAIEASGLMPGSRLSVRVRRQGDLLLAEVWPFEGLPDMADADRIAALGGRTAARDGILRVEVPCE